MNCTSVFDGSKMNVALNSEQLEEVECFKYVWAKIIVDGGIDTEVKFRINDVGKVLGGMKKVFSCRVMEMNVKEKVV